MTRRVLGTRPGSLIAVGLTTAVAAVAGIAPHSAAPAAADPGTCVSAFPTDSLVADQEVTGLTVTRGTDPEGFGGTYLDTLEDGIAPGVDMIIATLDSEAIKANGIWQGMSGSPVYDPATGDLIGAVAYGLSMGPSTIAGITPASHMLGMLPTDAPLPATVTVPRALRPTLVASGATKAQAASGLHRLPTPMAVSGLTQRRLRPALRLVRRRHHPRLRQRRHLRRRDPGRARRQPGRLPVLRHRDGRRHRHRDRRLRRPRGRLRPPAQLRRGHDVLAARRGRGHHPARRRVPGYKLANLGAPIGTVTEDRLTGIHGVTGAAARGVRRHLHARRTAAAAPTAPRTSRCRTGSTTSRCPT